MITGVNTNSYDNNYNSLKLLKVKPAIYEDILKGPPITHLLYT